MVTLKIYLVTKMLQRQYAMNSANTYYHVDIDVREAALNVNLVAFINVAK